MCVWWYRHEHASKGVVWVKNTHIHAHCHARAHGWEARTCGDGEDAVGDGVGERGHGEVAVQKRERCAVLKGRSTDTLSLATATVARVDVLHANEAVSQHGEAGVAFATQTRGGGDRRARESAHKENGCAEGVRDAHTYTHMHTDVEANLT